MARTIHNNMIKKISKYNRPNSLRVDRSRIRDNWRNWAWRWTNVQIQRREVAKAKNQRTQRISVTDITKMGIIGTVSRTSNRIRTLILFTKEIEVTSATQVQIKWN